MTILKAEYSDDPHPLLATENDEPLVTSFGSLVIGKDVSKTKSSSGSLTHMPKGEFSLLWCDQQRGMGNAYIAASVVPNQSLGSNDGQYRRP